MKIKVVKISLAINFACFFLICLFSFTAPTTLFQVFGREFQISFYVSIFAIPFFYLSYFLLYKKRSINGIICDILIVFLILFISSIGMSFFYFQRFNGVFSTTPPQTVLEEAIKYAYDLLLFPYIIYMLSLLKKKTIEGALNTFIICWILFGLFQIFVFYVDNDNLWEIYDSLDILKCIGGTSEMLKRIQLNYGYFRFYGISSEPSLNAILIDAILLPYLAYEIISRFKKVWSAIPYICLLLFVLLFGVLTVSSAVYAGLLVDLFCLLFVFFKSKSIRTGWKISLCLLTLGALLVITAIPTLRNIFWQDFVYKLFGKSNYSTQYRYSTVWNDLCCLLQSPLFGVGDGLQGLFYTENVANTWMAYNSESQSAIKGERGLLSGGAGIPSLISGFGFFGVCLIMWLLVRTTKRGSKGNSRFSSLKPFYVVGLLTTIVLLTVADGIHRNVGLFLVLSLPFLSKNGASNLSEAAREVLRPNVCVPLKFVLI